jgi:hypothetical protein
MGQGRFNDLGILKVDVLGSACVMPAARIRSAALEYRLQYDLSSFQEPTPPSIG